MSTMRGAMRRLRGQAPPVPGSERWRGLSGRSAAEVLDLVYELVLGREPDPTGTQSYLQGLKTGAISPQELTGWAVASGEWWSVTTFRGLGQSLHFSRMMFVRSLPAGRRILDLGGTALGNATGALVLMGYPYEFDDLVVIDLPSDERNELYREAAEHQVTQTELGPVRYRYHSMVDLSSYPDNSVDLVYSGQSIEHVPRDVADAVLSEVRRVLRPGGHLGLDTPNARVTRLERPDFIDPDHEYEYTDAEMREKLAAAGFDILSAVGLNHAGPSLSSGRFDPEQVATARGMFHEIADCYLLAYVCRVPERTAPESTTAS
jgi:ubiquinone/menaquinone biosynthesis C-methylase UbiE